MPVCCPCPASTSTHPTHITHTYTHIHITHTVATTHTHTHTTHIHTRTHTSHTHHTHIHTHIHTHPTHTRTHPTHKQTSPSRNVYHGQRCPGLCIRRVLHANLCIHRLVPGRADVPPGLPENAVVRIWKHIAFVAAVAVHSRFVSKRTPR